MNGYTKSLDWRVFISEEMGDAANHDGRRFVAGVYAECGPRLYRYALMILADRRDAEDVLQQVFAAVLSKRTSPSIDDAGAYFRMAVRNAAYSLLRQRRTAAAFAKATAPEHILEPVVPGCSPAEQAALEQALRVLPPEQREVVHLHVYEGMTFQEVATTIWTAASFRESRPCRCLMKSRDSTSQASARLRRRSTRMPRRSSR